MLYWHFSCAIMTHLQWSKRHITKCHWVKMSSRVFEVDCFVAICYWVKILNNQASLKNIISCFMWISFNIMNQNVHLPSVILSKCHSAICHSVSSVSEWKCFAAESFEWRYRAGICCWAHWRETMKRFFFATRFLSLKSRSRFSTLVFQVKFSPETKKISAIANWLKIQLVEFFSAT